MKEVYILEVIENDKGFTERVIRGIFTSKPDDKDIPRNSILIKVPVDTVLKDLGNYDHWHKE